MSSSSSPSPLPLPVFSTTPTNLAREYVDQHAMDTLAILTTDDLRQRLCDLIPGAIGLIARGFDVSSAELIAAVETGRVSWLAASVALARGVADSRRETYRELESAAVNLVCQHPEWAISEIDAEVGSPLWQMLRHAHETDEIIRLNGTLTRVVGERTAIGPKASIYTSFAFVDARVDGDRIRSLG